MKESFEEIGARSARPILVSGSLAYDRIMNFPGYFRDHILRGGGDDRVLNLSFVVDRLVTSRGGTAGNIAHTVKLLGGNPLVVGALGSDGGEYLDHFAHAKIDARGIARDAAHLTSSVHIITDREDNQITGFFGGAAASLTPKIANVLRRGGGRAGAVDIPAIATISPTHVAVMKHHFHECVTLGMTVMFDPGQQINALPAADLRAMARGADIVIGNDYETKILQERTGRDIGALVRGGGIVIVTHGARGSIIYHRGDNPAGKPVETKIPPCRLPARRVVDPTGAGDAYRAGLLVGLADGRPLAVAGRMGSVAASFAVEHAGTQEHHFTRQEFWKRYNKAYGKITH